MLKKLATKCINAIRLNQFKCIKSCSFNLKRVNLTNACIKFILKIPLSCLSRILIDKYNKQLFYIMLFLNFYNK